MKSRRTGGLAIGGRDELGIQRRAVSLELVGEPAAPKITGGMSCDWDRFCDAAGLECVERAVFLLKFRDLEPNPGAVLGLSHAEITAIARKVLRKARKNEAAVSSCFRELSPAEIILRNLAPGWHNDPSLKPISRGVMNLQNEFEAARATLDRLSQRANNLADAAGLAEREAARLEGEAKERLIDDLLENKSVNPASADTKKIETLRSKATAARSERALTVEALQRQRAVVDEIEGRIRANRHVSFSKEIEGPRRRAEALIYDLANVVSEATGIVAKYQDAGATLLDGLFPAHSPDDGLGTFTARLQKLDTCAAALKLHGQLFGGRAA